MLALVSVIAQLAVANTNVGPTDSTYSTPSLKSFIAAAALANREAPAKLNAYRAHLESEIGLIIIDTLGRERTGQVEQLASTVTWSRDSGYRTHVQGYRTQAAGIPFSMAGVFGGWSLPMLYGERLLLGVEGTLDTNVEVSRRRRQRDTIVAVHPFAADRDRFYRFTGGDTVATLTTETGRQIRIVRVRTIPNLGLETRFAAFDGEIDVDAASHDIVRMRGRFVVNKPPELSLRARLIIATTGTVGVAYAEFVNAQYEDRFWLPATQRIEFQANIALFGGMRSAVRVVSRFSNLELADTVERTGPTPRAAYTRRRLSFAPNDSMSAFSSWDRSIGEQTSSVMADDFSDVAPAAWKKQGAPIWSLYPTDPDRIVRYDRIEGLFTGLEGSVKLRSAAPGVAARAWGGWAWSEQTARGGAAVSRSWSTSSTAIDAQRALVSTSDFRFDFDGGGGSSLGALLGSVEDVDYVDRWSAQLAHVRSIGIHRGVLAFGQLAYRRDEDVAESITHGPIATSTLFRPNRHAATGNYGFGSVDLQLHPNVTGLLLDPGVGLSLHAEQGLGQLNWARVESSLMAYKHYGPVTTAARISGGAVFSNDPPPQTLYELGGFGTLEGYDYKQFAGDRAAIFRGYALYGLPLFRAPYRIKRFLIPGLSPGIGAGIDGGWTGISSDAAQRSVLALGDGVTPISVATGRVRSSAFVGVTFFAHTFHVGLSRPTDHADRWRWVFGIGQGF